ncbi:MAG: PAS domain S-box protein, partial [Campylobacteraceae bacterium]|nr:PAS domain S-box protein [Campylobacteraceae bacterium]
MNISSIKLIVFILSLIFLMAMSRGWYLIKYNDKLLNNQIKITNSMLLSKNTSLQLNNTYHSIFVNYDKITQANKKNLENIKELTKTHDDIKEINNIKKIVLTQDRNIDIIKRTNSIITNSIYYIRYLSMKLFFSDRYKYYQNDKSIFEFRKLLRKIVFLSDDIKVAGLSEQKKLENTFFELKKLKIKDMELKKYQKILINHTDVILKNVKLLSKNINMYRKLDKKLNKIYNNMIEIIILKHKNTKVQLLFIQIIILLLLLSFIYLIARFLRLEKKAKDEQNRLQELISKNIILSTTDLDGVITSVSDAYCNISGYTKKELLGATHNIMRHPNMAKNTFENLRKTIKSGKTWQGKIKNMKK